MNLPHSTGKHATAKLNLRLKSLFTGVLSLFLFGAISVTDIAAQTPSELGDILTEEMIFTFQNEIEFLEDEIENPSPNIDASRNAELIEAYEDISQNFENGGNLIDLLSSTLVQLELNDGNNYISMWGQNANNNLMDEDALTQKNGNYIYDEVMTTEELNEIFLYVRTLKNQ